MSRMTVVSKGSDEIIEKITKQLNKLVEVVKVVDLSEAEHIERELMLIKVRAGVKERDDVKRMALPALRHRVTPAPELEIEGHSSDTILKALLEKVEAPRT
jgi:acetolactate synthase small subunit